MSQGIVRVTKAGQRFEIIVDVDAAYAYKSGGRQSFENVLVVEEVFKDARKGERASTEAMKKAFGTSDKIEAAKRILAEGEVPITTEMRQRLIDERRAKIVALIARSCIDARTKAPLPPARIEAAFNERGVAIDPFKPAEEQLAKVIEALREAIPISFEKIMLEVRVPARWVHRCYAAIKEFSKREEWLTDGSLLATIELPAALQSEFYDRLNKLTSGEASISEVKG